MKFRFAVRSKAMLAGRGRIRLTHSLIGIGGDGRIFTTMTAEWTVKAKHPGVSSGPPAPLSAQAKRVFIPSCADDPPTAVSELLA
jgi:hypothetical protein